MFFNSNFISLLLRFNGINLSPTKLSELGSLILSGVVFAFITDRIIKNYEIFKIKIDAEIWYTESFKKYWDRNMRRALGWNYLSPNKQVFFDLTHVNSANDRIIDHEQKLLECRGYLSNEEIDQIDKMLAFHDKVEEGYILGEEMIALIDRYVDKTNYHDDVMIKNILISSVLGIDAYDYDPHIHRRNDIFEQGKNLYERFCADEKVMKRIKKLLATRKELENELNKLE